MVCTKRSAASCLSSLAVSVRTPLAICYFRRSWYPFEMYRDLETRKEMRERAWEVDGWADTVHKARRVLSLESITILLTGPTDFTAGKVDGFAYFDAVTFQPVKMMGEAKGGK